MTKHLFDIKHSLSSDLSLLLELHRTTHCRDSAELVYLIVVIWRMNHYKSDVANCNYFAAWFLCRKWCHLPSVILSSLASDLLTQTVGLILLHCDVMRSRRTPASPPFRYTMRCTYTFLKHQLTKVLSIFKFTGMHPLYNKVTAGSIPFRFGSVLWFLTDKVTNFSRRGHGVIASFYKFTFREPSPTRPLSSVNGWSEVAISEPLTAAVCVWPRDTQHQPISNVATLATVSLQTSLVSKRMIDSVTAGTEMMSGGGTKGGEDNETVTPGANASRHLSTFRPVKAL
jgi:hypothetical protein